MPEYSVPTKRYVDQLDGVITDHQNILDNNQLTAQTNITSRVSTAELDISSNETNISQNAQDIIDNSDLIDINADDIEQNVTAITNIESKVGIGENLAAKSSLILLANANRSDTQQNATSIAELNTHVGIGENLSAENNLTLLANANRSRGKQNATAINQLSAQVGTDSIDAGSTLTQAVNVNTTDAQENASAITTIENQVGIGEEVLAEASLTSLANANRNQGNVNASAINTLEARVGTSNIDAAATLTQAANINTNDIGTNASAITTIENYVGDTSTNLSAGSTLTLAAEKNTSDIGSNATAIADIEAIVGDGTGYSKSTLTLQASQNETDIGTNNTAIADLEAIVGDDTNYSESTLTLQATQNEDDIGTNNTAIADLEAIVGDGSGFSKSTLTLQASQNEGDIDSNNTAIASLDARVGINDTLDSYSSLTVAADENKAKLDASVQYSQNGTVSSEAALSLYAGPNGSKAKILGDSIVLDGDVTVQGTFSITASDNISDVVSGADVTGNNTAQDIVNLPQTPSGNPGLFASSTRLGLHDGNAWTVYFENDSGVGKFFISGNSNNWLSWDGSTLGIQAQTFALSTTGLDIDSSNASISLGSNLFTSGIYMDGSSQTIKMYDDTFGSTQSEDALRIGPDELIPTNVGVITDTSIAGISGSVSSGSFSNISTTSITLNDSFAPVDINLEVRVDYSNVTQRNKLYVEVTLFTSGGTVVDKSVTDVISVDTGGLDNSYDLSLKGSPNGLDTNLSLEVKVACQGKVESGETLDYYAQSDISATSSNIEIDQYHPRIVMNSRGIFLRYAPNKITSIFGSGDSTTTTTSTQNDVLSVFGRTGNVNAQSGDYNASQITNFDSAAVDAVENESTLTVNGLTVTSDATFQGDVTTTGDVFETDAETVKIQDNLAVINEGETGSGVSHGFAGWEVDRGSLSNFYFGFDESRDRFVVGKESTISNRQVLAAREDNPSDGSPAIWNDSENRFDTGQISASNISDVSADSISNAHHTRYSDSEARGALQDGTDYIELNNSEMDSPFVGGQNGGLLSYDASVGLFLDYGSAGSGITKDVYPVLDVGNTATGSNISLTYGGVDTQPFLSINQGSGSGLNADKLDDYEGDDLAALAEDETVTGEWDYESVITTFGNSTTQRQKVFAETGLVLDSARAAEITVDGKRDADRTLFGLYSRWNGNVVGVMQFRSGDDATNEDGGRITFSTRLSGGSVTERMRIEPNGNVGIGTETPGVFGDRSDAIPGVTHHISNPSGQAAQVIDGTGVRIDMVDNNGNDGELVSSFVYDGGVLKAGLSSDTGGFSTVGWAIDPSGNVGIGTTSPGYKLEVSGQIHASGLIESEGDIIAFVSSDRRNKKNFGAISDPLDKIHHLRGRSYEYEDDHYLSGERFYGLIAQDVAQVYPHAVRHLDDYPEKDLDLHYPELIPLAINGIKALDRKLDNGLSKAEKEREQLRQRVDELEQELEQYKN